MRTTPGRAGVAGRVVAGTFVLVVALAAASPHEALSQEQTYGLEQLARNALDSNRDLRAAREGLEGAEEQVSEAWSNVYPTIDLNASYSRNISPAVNFLPAVFF